MPKIPPAHGTDSRYTKGCRCDECRSAHAEARRNLRARYRVEGFPSHGTYGSYSNGCHCAECTAAFRKYAAARRSS